MTTLTVFPQADRGRVIVVFQDATPGGTLLRDGVPVRTPPLSGSGVVFDYEAQPGRISTYELEDTTATADLTDARCGATLVHPTRPSLSLRVVVQDDDPNEWTAPGTVHEVLGRNDPVVTYTKRTLRTGTVTFRTPWADRDRVLQLFADGTPILLNPHATCCALDYLWAWGRLRAEKPAADGSGGVVWTFDYQRIASPGGLIVEPLEGNSYAAVLADDAHPSYSTLPAQHPTYADLVTADHPHGSP